MLIERVKVKPPEGGEAQALYPLPGEAPNARPASVTIVNLDASVAVEVVDDPTRKAGEGISIAAKGERTFALAAGDALYALVASSEHEVCVIAGSL